MSETGDSLVPCPFCNTLREEYNSFAKELTLKYDTVTPPAFIRSTPNRLYYKCDRCGALLIRGTK